jgi:hypothetical protein
MDSRLPLIAITLDDRRQKGGGLPDEAWLDADTGGAATTRQGSTRTHLR